MSAAQRLCRSANAVFAGVCAGIAERLGLDAVAVRICAVLLALSTLGLAAVVYAVLGLVLPCRMDMTPETVPAAGYSPSSDREAPGDGCSGLAVGSCAPSRRAKALLWSGLALLALAAATFLAAFSSSSEWWRFLPVAICLAGLALMLTPSSRQRPLRRLSLGLSMLFLGLYILCAAVDVLPFSAALLSLAKLWPGFLVIAGLVVIGFAANEDMLFLAAAGCFAAMCGVAVVGFGQTAPLERIPAVAALGSMHPDGALLLLESL